MSSPLAPLPGGGTPRFQDARCLARTRTPAFALTSFLYGGNAAYIEDLYARYEADPNAVDAEWRAFFQSLKDDPAERHQERARRLLEKAELAAAARMAIWSPRSTATGRKPKRRSATRSRRRRRRSGVELSSADVLQATRDSIHALMLIRAYRIRGHFHAKLDPLELEPEKNEQELDPRSYGFTEADMDRKIFLDKVLGLEFASHARDRRHPAPHLLPDARRRVHAHLRCRRRKAGSRSASKGRDKEITFTREGKRAILNKLVEAEGFEKFLDVKYTGTKRFGLDGAESLIPALEQIIKRGGNLGVKEIVLGMAHRGRLNVLTQVMGKPHRVLFHEFKGGSATPDESRRLRRREISPRRVVRPRVRRQQGASVAHGQIRRIWKSSIRSCSARCAPSRTSTAPSRTSARW